MECILNKVDPQFDATLGLQYRLSILLGQNGFSFLVTHVSTKKILVIESYRSSQSENHHSERGWPSSGNDYYNQLNKSELSHLSYQKVDIAVASHKITLAPHNFIHGHEFAVMSAAHSVHENEEILTELLFDSGPVIAIAIPKYIREYCRTLFPGAVMRVAPAVFVKGVFRKHSDLIVRQIFLNVFNGYFEMCVIQGSRLLYLNAFRYSAPSDVLYFVIFVLEQLGFVPSEENITLMGDISDSEIVFNQLKMYCASLRYAKHPDGVEYSETFADIHIHNYFTLLNIPLCE